MICTETFDPTQCALDAVAYRSWIERPDMPDDVEHAHIRRALTEALRTELTDVQARYVDAYYVQGLTMDQIGRRFGVSRSTVSRTLARARRRLWRVVRYSSIRLMHTPDGGE